MHRKQLIQAYAQGIGLDTNSNHAIVTLSIFTQIFKN